MASTQMAAPTQTAPDAQDLRMAEQNRLKGFLGSADEMTAVAEVIAPKTVEWVRSLTDAEIIPMGVKALGDIADDILVLDEIRQRFRRGHAIEGYANWTEFVEKNSKYGIRTVQRRLNEVHGVREYEKFDPLETTKCRLSSDTQEPETAEHKQEMHAEQLLADYLYVWEKTSVESADKSYLWLVENQKTGRAELWRTHELTRIIRTGEVKRRQNCEVAYGHNDSPAFRAYGLLYIAAAEEWAQLRLQELKGLRSDVGDFIPPQNPADQPTATPETPTGNGTSLYDPNFLSKEDADRLFAALSTLPWQSNKDKNRLVCWMGIPPLPGAYSSGEVTPWTPEAQEIQKRVQEATGFLFDSLLINSYKDGTQGMGFHVDEEDEGLWDFPIASVSLGARREFQTQRYTKTGHKRMPVSEIYTLPLGHGSLVVLPVGSQAEFQHRLRKTTETCGPRINVTFRMMTPSENGPCWKLPAPAAEPVQVAEPATWLKGAADEIQFNVRALGTFGGREYSGRFLKNLNSTKWVTKNQQAVKHIKALIEAAYAEHLDNIAKAHTDVLKQIDSALSEINDAPVATPKRTNGTCRGTSACAH